MELGAFRLPIFLVMIVIICMCTNLCGNLTDKSVYMTCLRLEKSPGYGNCHGDVMGRHRDYHY